MPTVKFEDLKKFTQDVFSTFNLSNQDAEICADILVMADLRGIPSHGVARLKRYVDGMNNGTIFPLAKPSVVKETPVTATIDGNAGLGQLIANYANNLAIEKAKKSCLGMVVVRNSNHFGIAGYYSLMALKENMIGITMTNSAPLVVPTFGKEMVIGTNPISFAAPANKKRPFVLDMATSVVPRGKLEVYNREHKQMPEGWTVDTEGIVTTDPELVLSNVLKRLGGGILPLGGAGEMYSGHKGYGLSAMVDILSGVLSGGAYANLVNKAKDGKPAPANVSHFFLAIDINCFLDLDTFTQSMDDFIDRVTGSAKAKDQNHIYIHGEKEYNFYDQYMSKGIPIQDKVYQTLKEIADLRNISFTL